MDAEEYGFKDKEIERVTSELTKANRREFGRTFKSAAEKLGEGGLTKNGTDAPVPVGTPKLEAGIGLITPETDAQLETNSDLSLTQNQTEPVTVNESGPNPAADKYEELYKIAKPLRTYERDVAEAIRSKNESVTSINIAAQKKREERHEPAPVKTEQVAQKSIVFLISIIMIFASVSIILIAYYMFANHEKAVTPASPTIIATNEKTKVDITGKSSAEIISQIKTAEKSDKQNDLTQIELTEKTTEGTAEVSAQKFFELVATSAPSALSRALGKDWVIGFHKTDIDAPFIFASVDSFEIAFDGMHRWEKDMAKNLDPLFDLPPLTAPAPISTGTSTATSTIPAVTAPTLQSNFSDLIVRNKDLRVLKDSTGKVVLLYSFLDPKNLVITSNEQTFREILNRFFSSQVR